MLVLSRKKGERILIGAGIEVTVLEVERGKVKLGLTAPPEVAILREELRHGIAAATSAPAPSGISLVGDA